MFVRGGGLVISGGGTELCKRKEKSYSGGFRRLARMEKGERKGKG